MYFRIVGGGAPSRFDGLDFLFQQCYHALSPGRCCADPHVPLFYSQLFYNACNTEGISNFWEEHNRRAGDALEIAQWLKSSERRLYLVCRLYWYKGAA